MFQCLDKSQLPNFVSEVCLNKRQWDNSMQVIRNSLFGTVQQSKVLTTKNYECSPGFVFLVRHGAIFYKFLGLGCFPHWGLEEQGREALPGDSYVQNCCIFKQLRCRNSSAAVKITALLKPRSSSLLPKNTSI